MEAGLGGLKFTTSGQQKAKFEQAAKWIEKLKSPYFG